MTVNNKIHLKNHDVQVRFEVPPITFKTDEDADPLRPSKGILAGLFIALVIWAGLMAAWFLAV